MWYGYAAEDSARPALDFQTLRAPLSPVQRLLLCLDVAAAAAGTPGMCRRLLAQAQTLLPVRHLRDIRAHALTYIVNVVAGLCGCVSYGCCSV